MQPIHPVFAIFFSMILAVQAGKPAWAAPKNGVQANSEVETEVEAAHCIAPYQFIELQAGDTGLEADAYGSSSAVLGMYERISPDGRLVLRSFSGRRLGDVALIELPAPDAGEQVVKTYATPLHNEAFPVQGSWRYLVDPDGSHYALADVLNKGAGAKPLFKGGMTGFYAAAAEVDEKKGEKNGLVQIRSLSWPTGDGLATQGQGALQARTITVDVTQNRITADTGRQVLCQERQREDGPLYALPMIAPDGQEFSAMPQTPVHGAPTMRVFGFGASGHGCELHETFTAASGKTIFGYAPERTEGNESGADLVFEAGGQIWWYSRRLHDSFAFAPPLSLIKEQTGEWLPTAFPGLTRDGRVIWGATWQDCTHKPCKRRVGYLIADPYQLPELRAFLQRVRLRDLPPACISTAAVLQERERFAPTSGLPLP